ncbi:MAG: hypothetical protein ACFNMB_00350 [Candidatus Saccharimonas sp.]
MKRFFVENAILIAISVATTFIAKAGHPAFAMSFLAVYAAIIIYLSEVRQIKETARQRRLEERLADEVARERRLGEMLVSAATEALWVNEVIETPSISSYVIDVPEHGRIVVHLPATEEDTKTDDAPEASKEG